MRDDDVTYASYSYEGEDNDDQKSGGKMSDDDPTNFTAGGATRYQPEPMTGETWVIRLKAYNELAWEQFFDDYVTDLRKDIEQSLRSRDLPPEMVEDVLQDTWFTAIELIYTFKWQGEDQMYHWLRSISVNHIKALTRKTRKEQLSLDELDDDLSEFRDQTNIFDHLYNSDDESPEEITIRNERIAFFNSALNQLKPRDQVVLTRWLYGETPAQIANDYGIKASSISMALLRAKEIIKKFTGNEY